MFVRDACRKKETTLDLAAAGLAGLQGPMGPQVCFGFACTTGTGGATTDRVESSRGVTLVPT